MISSKFFTELGSPKLLENNQLIVSIPDEYCIMIFHSEFKAGIDEDECGFQSKANYENIKRSFIGIRKVPFFWSGTYKIEDLAKKRKYFYSSLFWGHKFGLLYILSSIIILIWYLFSKKPWEY